MLRRRPFLIAFASLLLLLAAGVGLFVLTFDLNRYRQEVQVRLTSVLGRPLTLGDAQLSLRNGLALSFSSINVPPTAEAPWSVAAGSLRTKLKIFSLFGGRVEFSEIVLVAPHLHVILRPETSSVAPAMPAWEHIGIRALTVRDGTLTVEDRRDNGRPSPLKITNLQLRLLDFAAGRRAWLTLAGQIAQDGKASDLNLAGEIVPGADLRQSPLNLALQVKGFDAALLAPSLPGCEGLTGSLSLALNLSGSVAAGLKVTGELNGEGLTAALPAWYAEPLAIGKLRLAGAWTQEAGVHRLTEWSVSLDALSAAGTLQWQRKDEDLWLAGALATPVQPVDDLTRLLPDRAPAAAIKGRLAGGTWQIESLHFNGLAKDLAAGRGVEGKFHVQDLRLHGADPRLGPLSFAARVADDRLQVDGTASLWQAPFRVGGTVDHPFSAARQIAADFDGVLPAARLLAELPAASREKITAGGRLPVSGTIRGNAQELKLTVNSRLGEVALSSADRTAPPIPLAGTVALAASVRPDKIEVERAHLQSPFGDVRGRGKIETGGRRHFALALEINRLDLEKLRPHLSIVEMMKGTGWLDGRCELAGADGRLQHRKGVFHLRDVGVHLTEVIAPLRNINGRLRLGAERLDIEQATALLGRSPISVSGNIRGPEAFTAELHVRGKSIRADELIFASEQLLRDVDGKLRIDRHGIEFAPATVRLDGGTEASVRGNVTFAPAAVTLDITAARGNIDEVIALWQKPAAAEAAPAAGGGEENGGVKVHISARVEEGTIGALQFRQAEGEISYEDDLLEIFPLRFRVGPGSCIGRVAVEFADGAPLLKTSGHLENVDAAAVYQQLLKRRGLITGTMHGDFYLEGRIGSDFLQTSSGGFSLVTKDGVLRKFSILGKIFSVLNVSQILTLQLPDMARDGMPFQRLAGNFAMRQGVLSTEDLFIKSPAMNLSVVGELNLPAEKIDLLMGIKPLRTVDKIVTSIPIAGWLLAGEEKALITVHFHIHGHPDEAEIDAVPITSLSEKVFGIFRRVLNLPGKMIDDVGGLVGNE